jgi:hypothetical protein
MSGMPERLASGNALRYRQRTFADATLASMRVEQLNAWKRFCIVATVLWVAGMAFFAIWHEGTESDRLRFWADAIEMAINSDPTITRNATELRSKLGDEQFIAAAPLQYPEVDLRDTLLRYEAERAGRSRLLHPTLELIFWMLIPPLVLYALGLLVSSMPTVLRRFRAGRSPIL